jgi:solute:Na+ symporter, SSS family
MLLTFIVLYLLATIALGFWASRKVKNTQDFALAGRKMPVLVVASSLFATWFGSETVMGASSEFLDEGVLGLMEDPFGAALCLFLIAIFFVKPLYRLNILTFSDYFRLRFDKSSEILSAVLMIPSYFTWISAQLVAMAVILQVIAGVPIVWGVVICTLAVVCYTYMGGMWAVSITDTVQTAMIIIGLGFVMGVVLNEVGGIQPIIVKQPVGFFNFLPKNTAKDWIHYFAAWITIGLGSIPQQDVFQRVLSAKNERIAIVGTYLSGVLYLSIAFIPLVIALAGRTLYADLAMHDTQMMIPFLVLKHTGIGIQILFFGALLSAILSTASGAILAPATVVAENLLKPIYGAKISDKNLLLSMRLSVVAIALISAWISTLSGQITELVAQSSALSLVSLFVPLTAGIYTKKSSTLGANLSMLFGIISWSFFEFFYTTAYPSLIFGLIFSTFGLILGTVLKPEIKNV